MGRSIRFGGSFDVLLFFCYNLFMNSSLKNRSALVVGGSGGIGKSVSLALASLKTVLTIHGSQKSEKFESLISEIEKVCGETPKVITQNLLERPFSELENSELVEAARKTDILCVCFGPFVQKPLHETSLSDWEKVSLYDYALPGLLVSAALPNMMKNHFGRILLFGGTGTSFRKEFSTNAAYAGAKSALNVLVSSVAANYAQYGITCNAICPGFVETEYLSEELKTELAKKMPGGKLILPETVAETAVFLMNNPMINGEILRIDGGWSPNQCVMRNA